MEKLNLTDAEIRMAIGHIKSSKGLELVFRKTKGKYEFGEVKDGKVIRTYTKSMA